jgi:hypothetical protein
MSTGGGNPGENPLSKGKYKRITRRENHSNTPIHLILTLTQKENNNKKEKEKNLFFLWSSNLFFFFFLSIFDNY